MANAMYRFLRRRFGITRENALQVTAAQRVYWRDHFPGDHLFERQCLGNCIAARSENGEVVVVESGRDCDGVQYSGVRYYTRATLVHVEKVIADAWNSADGPVSHQILSPTQAGSVRYESRDLTLEAFENGHPHVLRP